MILTDLSGRKVYVNPAEVSTVVPAVANAIGCRALVQMRDGRVIEAQESFEEVIAGLEPTDRLEKSR